MSESMLKAGRPSAQVKPTVLTDMVKTFSLRRVNFDVPLSEYIALKMYAAEHNMSIKDIFRDHIAALLGTRR